MLGVARTLTSATRLLDVLALLRPEDGIEVAYTVNPGSAFAAGLEEYLVGVGAEFVPWREATRRRFDLAVSCTVNASMRRLGCPLIVLPHGAGYNRLVPETTGDAVSPAGLSRRELMHWGRVVPAAIGVSHEEQIERLAQVCPPAAPRALVVGDWCFDRIRASLERRDVYRARLGVGAGRRLVVLHSTWGEHSLLGRCPDLPLRLVAALPVDEFAVAAVLHPNVWAWHRPHSVYQRLATAMDAGLMVIPPHEGWRAAVVAGDWVVGDHGSTSFYSAAADRVTLLAATGLDELDPASPTADFARTAPRLDPDGDLYEQLRQAARQHSPERLRPIVDRQLGVRGEAGTILRRWIYGRLGIDPPPGPPRPVPVPDPELRRHPAPATYDVTGGPEPDGTVRVTRRPVVSGLGEARGFFARADHGPAGLPPKSVEVLARTVVDAELPPVEWVARAAEEFPDLNIVVAPLDDDRCLVRLRGGHLLEAHAVRPWGHPRPRLDALLLGCAVNLWWLAETSRDPVADAVGSGLRVRTGERVLRVEFTQRRV
ncbi:hypothetical protein SGFS_028720 [Streptomyces graminofaciens]|uniref:Translation initiation factor IF-2 n=1 Tax=Streptomyces graminofaciens TaxID=68212 RepID=A0ABN5VF39_9ACTN|nr:hypothetical protein SGFS_028720 [Streptomyces graminofaciens]